MVFSRTLDELLFLYTDLADTTEFSVKDGKLRSVRPLRDVRVQNASNLDLEKAMGRVLLTI